MRHDLQCTRYWTFDLKYVAGEFWKTKDECKKLTVHTNWPSLLPIPQRYEYVNMHAKSTNTTNHTLELVSLAMLKNMERVLQSRLETTDQWEGAHKRTRKGGLSVLQFCKSQN